MMRRTISWFPGSAWQPTASRRGLSTLEMVLAMPLLLMIMALMINYSTVSAWKVRGLTVARNELWSSRWPRNPNRTPRPENWPDPGTMASGGTANAAQLDLPAVNLPVARGPALPFGAIVNRDLLDPTAGLRQGNASMERDFPLLASMGQYDLQAHSDLLDNKWQFQRMNWPAMRTDIPWNDYRRIPVIYGFPAADPVLMDAYIAAVVAIYYAPFRPDLFPLDRDDEFRSYSQRFSYSRRFRSRVGSVPDFHPELARYCGLDHDEVQPLVDDLADRIRGRVERDDDGNITRRVPSVATRMTDAFINLYEAVIDELNDLIHGTPAPTPAEKAGMRAEITDLQEKIETLRTFRAGL